MKTERVVVYRRLNISGVLAAFTLGFGAFPVFAEILDTRLVIGEGWAVVREVRRVPLRVGEQDLYFDHIPEEADLSSLVIRTRRGVIELREWARVGAWDSEGPVGEPDWLERVDEDGVTWRPPGRAVREETFPRDDRAGMVWCRVHTLLLGMRSVELIYRIEGVSWEPEYQVLIRGDPEGADETVAVDVFGTIRIRNTTSRSYDSALIRLVGAERSEADERSYRGFLMLEDGPLAALWEPPEPEARPEFVYQLPRRVTVEARAETEIHFITASRIPARRRYVLDADETPLTLRGTMNPLRKLLVFRNVSEQGLGVSMPPGVVTVYHGGRRRHMLQEARLPHTPVDGDIRIDFGLEEDVLGRRRTVERTEPMDGYYEEVFEIQLRNNRPGEIAVEIRERPHLSLAWDVVRAPVHEREPNRLLFSLTVPPESGHRLSYRLRFHQPAL